MTISGITINTTATDVAGQQTTSTIKVYAPTNNCDLIYTSWHYTEQALVVKHCTSTSQYVEFTSNHTNVGAIVLIKLY